MHYHFVYAHLAGKCRHRIMLQSFGEDDVNLQCPDDCCDVCQLELGTLIDQSMELSILLKAIDELPKWVRLRLLNGYMEGKLYG